MYFSTASSCWSSSTPSLHSSSACRTRSSCAPSITLRPYENRPPYSVWSGWRAWSSRCPSSSWPVGCRTTCVLSTSISSRISSTADCCRSLYCSATATALCIPSFASTSTEASATACDECCSARRRVQRTHARRRPTMEKRFRVSRRYCLRPILHFAEYFHFLNTEKVIRI